MSASSQTEIEGRRAAWWMENFKPEMTTTETLRLIEECVCLFPQTPEERRQKFDRLTAIPKFVL